MYELALVLMGQQHPNLPGGTQQSHTHSPHE